jgi:hypothetical protein
LRPRLYIIISSVDATGSAGGSMCDGFVTLILVKAAGVFFIDAMPLQL